MDETRAALQTLLPPAIAAEVPQRLNTVDDLTTTLQKITQTHSADLTQELKDKLSLASTLLIKYHAPVSVLRPILVECDSRTVQDAISRFWENWHSNAATRSFAESLFSDESSAVIKALISSGRFSIKPTIRFDVLTVLDTLEPTFDLLRQPLLEIHPAFAAVKTLDRCRKKDVLELFASIQQICQVVITPLQLPILISLGFKSAEQIAYAPLQAFTSLADKHGISEDYAKRIHSEAISVQIKQEQAWMAIIQNQSSDTATPPIFDLGTGATHPNDPPKRPPPGQTNLAAWFGDLDQVSCPDCCSVTSPAAYFVDLLRMLKNLPDPASYPKDIKTPPSSLLAKLFSRRPDLGELLLSCRNTNEVVPYVDLVNEALESAVAYVADKTKISGQLPLDVHNADATPENASQVRLPRSPANIRDDVYTNFISKKVYPSHIFPYDYALDSLRQYLAASKTGVAEILQTFRADARLAQNPNLSRLLAEKVALNNIHSRARAAEILGMTRSDFVALTHESFFDRRSAMLALGTLSLSRTDYEVSAGFLPIAEYWGYPGESGIDDMLDTEEGNGVSFIKSQLMPRLSINFTTLLQILTTTFLGRRLVISPLPENSQLPSTGRVPIALEGFRLRRVESDRQLDEDTCHKLEQFVRLWRRLGWSIETVDDAISAFSEAAEPSEDFESTASSITPDCVEQLAAVARIASMTKVHPERVVAMFFQHTHYILGLPIVQSLAASVKGSIPKVFAVPQPGLSLSDYAPLLLASIDMTYEELLIIQKAEALEDSLTVHNIFVYNRACEATRIFGTTYLQLNAFLTFMPGDEPPLASPKAFLEALERWEALKESGWKIEDLLGVYQNFNRRDDSVTVADSTVKFATDVLRDVASSRTALSVAAPQKTSEQKAVATPVAVSRQAIETAARSAAPALPLAHTQYLLRLDRGHQKSYEAQLMTLVDEKKDSDLSNDGFDGALFCTTETRMDIEASVAGPKPIVLQHQQDLVQFVPQQNGAGYQVSCSLVLAKDTASLLTWPPGTRASKVSFYGADGKPLPDSPHIIDKRSLIDVQNIVTQLQIYGQVLERYPLSLQEMTMLERIYPMDSGTKLVDITARFAFIRKNLAKPKGQERFARFFEALLRSSNDLEDLPMHFGEATVLSKSAAEVLLQATFPGSTGDALKTQLRSLSAMDSIARQVDFLRRTGLKEDALELLFKLAEPIEFGSTGDSTPSRSKDLLTDLVQRVRSSMISRGFTSTIQSTQDTLRERRRRVLLQYLIQHPAIRGMGVADEDDLFKYFLIDVQMGCGLDTTRIKQAISTVQLFVHRCLLGLEEGVDGSLINRERWQWMQKYTLWEANRKVFLYPENWAEPSLRESKTSLFKTIEEAMMQTNLDDKSIHSIIRSYVCGADEIANLSVEAFFWDVSSNSSYDSFKEGGSFHLFARTRNMPFQYYYRRMDYLGGNSLPSTTWTAWEKLPFDIQANGSDAAGASLPDPGVYIVPVVWRGRLMVFLPQLSICAPPSSQSSAKAPGTVAMKQTGDKPGNMELDLAGMQQNVKRNVEIKITWSELVDDMWLPQKQTQETITAEGVGTEPPAFSSFRFAANSTKDQLSISVFRLTNAVAELSDVSCIGRFILQGPRLDLVPAASINGAVPFVGQKQPNTNFGRFKRNGLGKKVTDLAKIPTGGDANYWPALSRPPINTARSVKSITWTLDSSARNSSPKGLIADAAVSDGLGFEPWFTLPNATPGQTINPDLIDDVNSVPLYNGLAEAFKAALSTGDGVDSIYSVMERLEIQRGTVTGPDSYNFSFGVFKFTNRCVEDATPYSIYNWELGFHIVSLLTERLVDLQQFDMALKYARLVFDPTGKAVNSPGQRPVWRFPPFRDPVTRSSGTLDAVMDNYLPSSGAESTMNPAVLEWRRNPFKPHAVAAGRPLAYMKRFVMKYIEALVAAGDILFRQNSLESLPLAIQHYIEASQIFGPAPHKIPQMGEKRFKSFNDLDKAADDFSNALVDLRLTFPYFVPLDQRGVSPGGSKGLQGFTKTRYFGVQANPEFIALRELVDDRLIKIRNGMDINGKPRTLALWDPPIDVRNAVAAVAAGGAGGLGMLLSGSDSAMPRVRFQYLMQRALDVCAELKQSGNALLAAAEKKDGEEFQTFKAKQETGSHRILIDMKKRQKIETEKGVEQLELSRNAAIHRLLYYSSLTGDDVKIPGLEENFEEVQYNIPKPSSDEMRLTEQEELELSFSDTASDLNTIAYALEIGASYLSMIPMPTVAAEPMGFGMQFQMPSLGSGLQIGAIASRGLAAAAADAGQRASRISGWTRQLQERRLQQNQAGQEIKNVDKQIEIQKARIEVIDKDIASSEKALDDAIATEEFLRSKFTNEALYSWLESNARSYHYQTYIMAMELAKKVESAYVFEMGPITRPFFSPSGYWDQSKRGLLSGEQLWFALKRMETDYVNQSASDYELTKNISLRQLAPAQLVQLREKGLAIFDLPELLFDLDFPGHYCRRIRSVAFSFHCITGPYTSINCTATLQKHRFRIEAKPGSNYFEQGDRDSRFVGRDFQMPIDSIAICHGVQDSGAFELNFNTEAYQPFEGAGAISTWLLSLPDKIRQFDYSGISDVVMHLSYTSKNGGDTLRKTVEDEVAALLGKSVGRYETLLDIRNEAPDAWYGLNALGASKAKNGVLAIPDIRQRLPFYTRALKVTVKSMKVFTRGFICKEPAVTASKTADGADPITLSPTDVLGSLQTFVPKTAGNATVDGKKLEQLCSPGKPWYLTFASSDEKPPKAPTDVLLLFEYQLESP